MSRFIDDRGRDSFLGRGVGDQQRIITQDVNQPRDTLHIQSDALDGLGRKEIFTFISDGTQPLIYKGTDFPILEAVQVIMKGDALFQLAQPRLLELSVK